MRLRLACIAMLSLMPCLAWAMEFSVERHEIGSRWAPTMTITATGPIKTGDTARLAMALRTVDDSDVEDVLLLLDSPGGHLFESLRLGDFIADLPAVVSAQVGSLDTPDGVCASACVYVYLAADYRYLSDRGRIGIHRFGIYDTEIDGRAGTALGQEMSGILSQYIRSHRAEPAFFEAISAIDHDDILWVPREDLEAWRVVTNGIYDETAEYININGKAALRLSQTADTGSSYLTLFCTESGAAGLADLHEPKHTAYGRFELGIGGAWHSIETWDVLERRDYRGKILFEFPPELVAAAIHAETIGARVVVPAETLFFGFEQTLRDHRLAELLRGCPTPAPARPAPRKPAPSLGSMTEYPATDLPGNDMTSHGFRDISFAECKQICLEHSGCLAVSYVQSKAWCWPKHGIGPPVFGRGVISATRD